MIYAGQHPERLAGLVIVDTGPEHDPRGQIRIAMDTEQHLDPSFESVAEYEAMLAHQYIAAMPSAIKRMARYGLRQRDDGRSRRLGRRLGHLNCSCHASVLTLTSRRFPKEDYPLGSDWAPAIFDLAVEWGVSSPASRKAWLP